VIDVNRKLNASRSLGGRRNLKIRRTGILLFILAFLLALSGVINCASATAEPWTGTRINILGPATQTVSSSDYSHVVHGCGITGWSVITGVEKADFVKGCWFELETTPTAFTGKLHRMIEYDKQLDTMFRAWWIQFRPGDLTPGTYSFTGKWYFDYILDVTETITVIVTS